MGRTAILALALALTPAFAQSLAADAERAARDLGAPLKQR
jgi:hypothetical protein